MLDPVAVLLQAAEVKEGGATDKPETADTPALGPPQNPSGTTAEPADQSTVRAAHSAPKPSGKKRFVLSPSKCPARLRKAPPDSLFPTPLSRPPSKSGGSSKKSRSAEASSNDDPYQAALKVSRPPPTEWSLPAVKAGTGPWASPVALAALPPPSISTQGALISAPAEVIKTSDPRGGTGGFS